jgi:ABC-type antimicrobial peptide transport system permease subunit
LLLFSGFRWIAAGLALGILSSYVLTRFLASQIYGVSPMDALTYIAVAILVVIASLAACLLPARRAASVDPLIALRHE